MKINKKNFQKLTNYEAYRDKLLKNPKMKKFYDEYGKHLEIAYQILQLRKKAGISQEELAKRLGTTQSNIARIETGRQNFTTITLQKIAHALDRDLKIEFV